MFADLADAVGAEGHTVRDLEDVKDITDVLERTQTGPVVVVGCKINHEVRYRSKM